MPQGDFRANRFLTLAYVVSLSIIAVLSIVVHIALDAVIREQENSATTLNISGQQRMLSQRIGWLTLAYQERPKQQTLKALAATLSQMQNNHKSLIAGDRVRGIGQEKSDAINAYYFSEPHNIHQRLQSFFSATHMVITMSANASAIAPHIEVIQRTIGGDLLQSLDGLVKQYETESNGRVVELRNTQRIVLVIILLTILAEAALIFRPMVNKVSQYTGELKRLAEHDELTGLLNRRVFYSMAREVIALCRRQKQPLMVAMLDIDKFKAINDSFGHDSGDQVIAVLGKLLLDNARESDVVCRFGGEEFALLLPDTDTDGARVLLERLRATVNDRIVHGVRGQTLQFTLSMGLAQWRSDERTIDDAVKRADEALYRAKQQGRNRIVANPSHGMSTN